MKNRYDDIINLPRHISKTRPRMSAVERSAQFAPFAALTGYDEAVRETARAICKRLELDEQLKASLNEKLKLIIDKIEAHPEILITYFQPDEKKDGGEYVTASGMVRKIDEHERIILMDNGIKIPVEEIIEIDGEIFSALL